MNKIIDREFPDAYRETLVVLDATTGQNALAQAKEFNEVADITGVILTKWMELQKVVLQLQSRRNLVFR